jgi:hypothetical protein
LDKSRFSTLVKSLKSGTSRRTGGARPARARTLEDIVLATARKRLPNPDYPYQVSKPITPFTRDRELKRSITKRLAENGLEAAWLRLTADTNECRHLRRRYPNIRAIPTTPPLTPSTPSSPKLKPASKTAIKPAPKADTQDR